MVFSSITFIYYFLPLLFLCYYLVPKKVRNLILLIFSLAFYFYGEPVYIYILILSILVNYIFAIFIDKALKKNLKKLFLILAIIFNLSFLIYFKYTNFLISNINNLFDLSLSLLNITMPIGISFFTFQTLSYVIDVYRGDVKASHNLIDFATYVSLFPQLVAGPIVRYLDIDQQLTSRKTSFETFSKGVKRFLIGLAKKVLIANGIGVLATTLLELKTPSVAGYFLYGVSYALQVYFDFSGYSDMAIGLGHMLGFTFLENFNYPFIAKSITEFWRRWHISLSSWFKDYVYIPLGGNRCEKIKWLRNILIVWFLTGLWHGASWNFILWGLYFGILLIIEKLFLLKRLNKHPYLGHVYTIFLVAISFIIFGIVDFQELTLVFKGIFGFANLDFINQETLYYFKDYFILLVIAVIAATPLSKKLINKISSKKIFPILEYIFYLILLILTTAYLIDSSFNPFLYFRF